MLQTDSIGTEAQAGAQPVQAYRHQLTPREVLSWLPKSATPAQQDSAVQRHIKVAPIHWSQEPDTLHMPGHSKGKTLKDVSLPQYYKESFFSKDSLFHPELPGGRLGVAGDPVPYSIANDNLITTLMFVCFVLVLVSIAQSRRFIGRQFKELFYVARENTTGMTETSNELRFQFFLVLQGCMLFALIFFFYTRTYVADTFTIEQYQIVGIYTAIAAGYNLFKMIAYQFVNWVFFDKKKSLQWLKTFLFLNSVKGVLLLPVVMLLAFFGLSISKALIYVVIVIFLEKLLSFYKQRLIFFNQKGVILQNILYFCTFEVMPLASLWGMLTLINNYLRIIY